MPRRYDIIIMTSYYTHSIWADLTLSLAAARFRFIRTIFCFWWQWFCFQRSRRGQELTWGNRRSVFNLVCVVIPESGERERERVLSDHRCSYLLARRWRAGVNHAFPSPSEFQELSLKSSRWCFQVFYFSCHRLILMRWRRCRSSGKERETH